MGVVGNSSVRTGGTNHGLWLGIAVLRQVAWAIDVAGNSSVRTGGNDQRCGWK